MVKDVFWDKARRFCEGPLLTQIHSKGTVPGVVRILGHEAVVGPNRLPISTYTSSCRRERKRIYLASRGSPLTDAASVLHLLMVLYDALEVHRYVLSQHSILHRDLSVFNILLNPVHSLRIPPSKSHAKSTPYFINDILRKTTSTSSWDHAQCLLIDWDNAAHLSEEYNQPEEALAQRTVCLLSSIIRDLIGYLNISELQGTPIYIARSVAAGAVLMDDFPQPHVHMPSLHGNAKRHYKATYGREEYRKYKEKGKGIHGSPPQFVRKKERKSLQFRHLPRHDVESVFWILVILLLRAKPLGYSKEVETPSIAQDMWAHLHGHIINNEGRSYSGTAAYRELIFSWNRAKWESALHPGLASLAPFLEAVASQVRPEYSLLSVAPPEEHLHEAVRRLLLQKITDMDDKHEVIPLDCGGRKMVSKDSTRVLREQGGGPGVRFTITEPVLPSFHADGPVRQFYMNSAVGTML